MRILSWNMGQAFRSHGKPAEAWAWLCDDADADVVLLQEAILPEWAGESWPVRIHSPKYPRFSWGSAILSHEQNLKSFRPTDDSPWLRALWGASIVAEPTTPGGLWFASLHASRDVDPEVAARIGLADVRLCNPPHVHEIDAMTHDIARLLRGKRSVVGGDLNSSLLWDASHGTTGSANVFANLVASGFQDFRTRFHSEEQQTLFKPGSRPYQDDHMYGDAGTESSITSWRVLRTVAEALGLSDHAPIEVTLP